MSRFGWQKAIQKTPQQFEVFFVFGYAKSTMHFGELSTETGLSKRALDLAPNLGLVPNILAFHKGF